MGVLAVCLAVRRHDEQLVTDPFDAANASGRGLEPTAARLP